MTPGGQSGDRRSAWDCRYCGGSGEVFGVLDDIQYSIQCACAGGQEEAVLWLLGEDGMPVPDYIVPRRAGPEK